MPLGVEHEISLGSMHEPAVGDQMDQYVLVELLARSGMGSVFKATDSESGATVALKIPHVQFESDVVFFERFRREEEIGQRLEHPCIIKVLKPKKKTRFYLAMEFVEGRSLRAILQAQGRRPLPTEQALSIARQLTEALVYLHEHGVIHRDLKPENVLLTPGDRIKILDFGIALDQSARRMTWTGLSSTVGTPDYMAPEQIGGRRGDARTDIYAVGTMLYEMLTGHLPYSGANAHAVMRAKTEDDPRPPGTFVPDLDPALESIILRAIGRSPRDRYETAAGLLADLNDPTQVKLDDPAVRAASRARRFRIPRRFVMPLAIVVIMSGLASLIWLSARRSAGPRPPGLQKR